MIVPERWRDAVRDGLVAGFGERTTVVPARARTVRQVHGERVVCVDERDPGEHAGLQADALVATAAGVVAAVKTADCVPVLIFADARTGDRATRTQWSQRRWAAAVHAGWRGTVAAIVARAVDDAVARGWPPEMLRAAIGPSIGPCCYEVGDEVADRFEGFAEAVIDRRVGSGKPHLDLRAANRELLERAGVAPARIEICAPCTRCHTDRYHSYRADPVPGRRQLSWIGWRPRDPA